MPLDNPRKIAHVQAVVQRAWTGRQKNVIFVYQIAGAFTYTAVAAIWKPQQVVDPQIPDRLGGAPGVPADLVMVVPLSTQMSGVVYVADTPTPTASAVAAAPKYEVIEAVPTGLLVGGTHFIVALRRFR